MPDNDELYRQYIDTENVLWPRILERMAQAVDKEDKKTIRRIHSRMARLARDVLDSDTMAPTNEGGDDKAPRP